MNTNALHARLKRGLAPLRRLLPGASAPDMPLPSKVRWQGTANDWEAAVALVKWARAALRAGPAGAAVLLVGEPDALQADVWRRLQAVSAPCLRSRPADLGAALDAAGPPLAVVLCTERSPARIHALAQQLLQHPRSAQVPFEYVPGRSEEQQTFARLDEYGETWFVSPVLLAQPSPYEIYQESLAHFCSKCGLRDFLDLYQLLQQIERQGLDGAVCEFGSFQGHSGWLIARSLEAMGSTRAVHLFDMFEGFPAEAAGVDHFWNDSHHVDFAQVRAKFSDRPQVRLVQGDFTQTFAAQGPRQVALAYIDCDSYRATREMIDQVWDHALLPGGLLVCEDYGHPALLGNRIAVEEQLAGRPDAFCFYSQFSGLYIARKDARP